MNINFLCYMSRSGSTLLAKKLDEYDQLGVTIEENWIDGIWKGKVLLKHEPDLDNYLKKVNKSEKFKFWNIDLDKLKRSLLHYSFPITYDKVLEEIIKQYFPEEKELYLHKRASYFLYYKKVWKLFPRAKIIFIDRDPRAIFNSQKNSKDSITGNSMRTNPVKFALSYKRVIFSYKKLQNNSLFLHVHYEDLLANQEAVINHVIDFLGLSNRQKSDSSYFQMIPETQKHLHQNLDKELNSNRIYAWQKELAKLDIRFLQFILDHEIKEKGLPLQKVSLRIDESFKLLMLIVLFYIEYIFSFSKTFLKHLFLK